MDTVTASIGTAGMALDGIGADIVGVVAMVGVAPRAGTTGITAVVQGIIVLVGILAPAVIRVLVGILDILVLVGIPAQVVARQVCRPTSISSTTSSC